MNAPACARCGQPITPGARFCTRCGSDVSGEQGNVATVRMPSVPAEEVGIDILRRATLGEYDVLAELGRGGMATVYLAHEISLDRKVAIKVMAPQLMFGQGMAERFRREARTAASLSHPHIIPIYAVKESGRVLYFVMKFVAGRPLDDIIRQVGPLPIPMARAILSQVGSALGYAHRRGIVHRDIKPANIMIDDEGWAVVTDFGIAKVAETQGLTMTGVAVGTPSYMSPEQCAAKEVTGRSDQYSLGIVAYEMITGKQPFVADTAMAIMWQHFNDPPRPIRERRSDCPPDLEAAVLRMIEKQPDKRWTSIEDAIGAIGATPLAHDDPIHIQMVGLAKSSLNQRLLDEMKTPTSLVPPTRASAREKTEVMPAVGSVALSPRSANMAAGDTLQLTVTVQDVKGDTAPGRDVSWSSANSRLASVSPGGLVTALEPGEVMISGTVENHSGTCQLVITPVPVVAVVVAPATGTIEAGATIQLSATLRDPQGKAVTGRPIAWSSSDPSVATVSAQGLVAGSSAGTARILAACEGKSGVATLIVAPAPVATIEIAPKVLSLIVGRSDHLTATVKDSRGHALTGRVVQWSSKSPAIATITASGEVKAVAPGHSEITASVEKKSAVVKLTVTLVPVARLQLVAPGAPLHVGAQQRLAVTIEDATGAALDRAASWSSSDPGILPVTATGEITALKSGSAEITVTVEGKTAREIIRVVPVPVARVQIIPPNGALAPRENIQLRAEARDERGTLLEDRAVSWSSSKPAVATVSAQGLLVAARPGRITVRADVEGKSAGAEFTVSAPVTEPVIAKPQVIEPAQVQPVTIRKSKLPLMGAALGLLLLVLALWRFGFAGRAGATGSATILEISPAAPSLVAGDSVQLQALYRDSANHEVEDARPVTWTSDNPAVAVTSGGWLKGVGGGSATVVAEAGGLRGTTVVSVRGAATPGHISVASLMINQTPSRVEAGDVVQLTVEARDETGAPLPGRPVIWTTSEPAVAQVSPAGLLMAEGEGTAIITGSSEGKTTTFSLVVAPVIVASVSVTPSRSSLELGGSIALTAQPKDARGNPLVNRPVQWTSNNAGVATVTADGTVKGVAVGTATITASVEGKTATASVTVALTRIEVATVTISPASGEITVGERLQLTAELKAITGDLVRDRTPSWLSSDPGVATVSPLGQVTAIAPGSTNITASSDEKRATVRITVAPIPVASVALVSAPPTLAVGEAFQLVATARDARGNPLADRPVTWSSSNPQVVAVTASGRLSAIAPGGARISATSEGKSININLTVPRPLVVIDTVRTPGDDPVAPPPTTGGGAVPRVAIAAGGNHTCGLIAAGAVACWGSGTQTPAVLETGVRFSRLSSGTTHTCGLTSGGEAYCWGQNSKGQIGDGSTNNTRATPVPVVGGNSYRMIRSGGRHTCGLTGSGRIFCWGENGSGQIGDGTTSGRSRPTPVPDLTFTEVAAGGSHSCGIATDGKTYCWGDGFSGQLGYGQLSTESNPVAIDAGAIKFAKVFAGGSHTCALTSGGKAYCWGDNRASQVGDGSSSDRTKPVEVAGGLAFEELSLGTSHTCGRTGGGALYCWGANGKGQVGDGTRGNRGRPVRVAVEGTFTSLSAGGTHTCAATATQVLCWGENARGQLGDGSVVARPTAAPVLGVQ